MCVCVSFQHIHHAEFEALPHTIQRDVVLFHRRHRWNGSHHLTPSRFNQHRVDRCRNYFHRRPTPKGALPTINVPKLVHLFTPSKAVASVVASPIQAPNRARIPSYVVTSR